jgi:hypothetical protein
MGILCLPEDSSSASPAKPVSPKPEGQIRVVESTVSVGARHPAVRKHFEETSRDHKTWHIRTRIISNRAGRSSGAEMFYSMNPSHVAVRPVPYYVLHLCQGEQRRCWDCSALDQEEWSHLEIKLSSSKAFSDDFGCRYPAFPFFCRAKRSSIS